MITLKSHRMGRAIRWGHPPDEATYLLPIREMWMARTCPPLARRDRDLPSARTVAPTNSTNDLPAPSGFLPVRVVRDSGDVVQLGGQRQASPN